MVTIAPRRPAAVVLAVALAACGVVESPEQLAADADALRAKQEMAASRAAADRYRSAVAGWRARGATREAAIAAQHLGATYQQLGELGPSIDAYRTALALARGTPDRALRGDVSSDLGIAESMVASGAAAFNAAEALCRDALTLATEAAAPRALARALQCLGDVAYQRQAAEEALERYQEAADALGAEPDFRLTAQIQLLLGQVNSDLGRFDAATRNYETARRLWLELADRRQQAITQVSIAKLHARRAEYHEALSTFESALELLRPMGDAVWEGSCLAGIAEVQLATGDSASAAHHWERALQIFERAGLQNAAIDVMMALGENDLSAGDDSQALERFRRALVRAESLDIDRWKAYALRYIGIVHLFRKEAAEARTLLEEALAIARTLGVDAGYRLEAHTLNELGEAYRMLGKPAVAFDYLNRSLALSRADNDRPTQAATLYTIARTHLDGGELPDARRRIDEALDVAESLRSDVLHRDLRATYGASVYRWYELQVDVLMRLAAKHGDRSLIQAAFEASERARARSLLDGLADSEIDLRVGVDASLLQREGSVLAALAKWAAGADRADGRVAPARTQEYRDLEYRFNQIEAEIRKKSPAYAASRRRPPMAAAEVQRQLLDPETMLLEYFFGEERSYLWVVSRSGIANYPLPPRGTIEPLARKVYELLTMRERAADGGPSAALTGTDAQYWREASRLTDILLGPVSELKRARRIAIVADGVLHYLPFAALPVPRSHDPIVPLVAQYEIVNIPSAASLRALRRAPHPKRSLDDGVAVLADPVFQAADPRLPVRSAVDDGTQRAPIAKLERLISTRQEAENIVRAASTKNNLKALGFDARRTTVTGGELLPYPIVHFATHSLVDNRNPGASGILLSQYDREGRRQDGFLRLHDIYRLRLPADLVVLSACDTALGEPIRGEGLVGIVRGFMQAGARRVVASHWKVDDEATGELMRRFYIEMLQHGRAPAAALREAQLAMRRLDRWNAPFYWAGFVLQGEWR